jgi:hypothetical protein
VWMEVEAARTSLGLIRAAFDQSSGKGGGEGVPTEERMPRLFVTNPVTNLPCDHRTARRLTAPPRRSRYNRLPQPHQEP